MISLSAQDIGQFREIWRKETGDDISQETARVYAEDILGIVAFVSEPIIRHQKEIPP